MDIKIALNEKIETGVIILSKFSYFWDIIIFLGWNIVTKSVDNAVFRFSFSKIFSHNYYTKFKIITNSIHFNFSDNLSFLLHFYPYDVNPLKKRITFSENIIQLALFSIA